MVIAFGMSSTIALDTSHAHTLRTGGSGRLLTAIEVLVVLFLVVAGVPAVLLAVAAHFDHKDELVVVPLAALHS